jgi:hypothetical protein
VAQTKQGSAIHSAISKPFITLTAPLPETVEFEDIFIDSMIILCNDSVDFQFHFTVDSDSAVRFSLYYKGEQEPDSEYVLDTISEGLGFTMDAPAGVSLITFTTTIPPRYMYNYQLKIVSSPVGGFVGETYLGIGRGQPVDPTDTCTTGIVDFATRNIRIFPTPAHDILYVKGEEIGDIELSNMTGVCVLQSTQHTIALRGLSPGLYILLVRSIDGHLVGKYKIVKE